MRLVYRIACANFKKRSFHSASISILQRNNVKSSFIALYVHQVTYSEGGTSRLIAEFRHNGTGAVGSAPSTRPLQLSRHQIHVYNFFF